MARAAVDARARGRRLKSLKDLKGERRKEYFQRSRENFLRIILQTLQFASPRPFNMRQSVEGRAGRRCVRAPRQPADSLPQNRPSLPRPSGPIFGS
jgi:hypothetical protein